MILQSEILRIAEKEGVPPDTIDKNWVLGHFLAELFNNRWAQNYLVFKGGTCLKKCYFEDYHFSEDLDFTLTDEKLQITNKMLQSVCDAITAQIGIQFSKVRVEPILWNDMQVGYKSHIRFWGANHKKGNQPPDITRWLTEIKIEIIYYEKIVNNPIPRPLLSSFSDGILFKQIIIPCYSLTEVIAEKFRALLQRSYPAPRDYYDLWNLLKENKAANRDTIVKIFKQKTDYKGIVLNHYEDFFKKAQIRKVKQAWKNSLQNHLKENSLPDSEVVITDLKDICSKINWDIALSVENFDFQKIDKKE